MKKAGEEIIMWFSESQLPRTLPRFGPITSAGETRFGSFSCWRYLFLKNSPRFPIWKNVFPFNDCNVISGIWQSWLWKSRGRFSFKSRATISGILRPRDTSSVAKARVQRKEQSITFSCDWFSLPFQRLQLFAVSFSCEITFFAQKSGRQDEAVR